jgi:hypothetical protein
VFLGIDLQAIDLRPVVVKLGYRNGAIQGASQDGVFYARREIDNYVELAGKDVSRHFPRLVASYKSETVAALVVEYILGVDLATAIRGGIGTLSDIQAAWNIMLELHASGYIMTDAKLANFVRSCESGVIYAIDLEMLRAEHSVGHRLKRTFRVIGAERRAPDAVDKFHFLASVFGSGRRGAVADRGEGTVTVRQLRRAVVNFRDDEISCWGLERLGELVPKRKAMRNSASGYSDSADALDHVVAVKT